jgi:hypothetical protein
VRGFSACISPCTALDLPFAHSSPNLHVGSVPCSRSPQLDCPNQLSLANAAQQQPITYHSQSHASPLQK